VHEPSILTHELNCSVFLDYRVTVSKCNINKSRFCRSGSLCSGKVDFMSSLQNSLLLFHNPCCVEWSRILMNVQTIYCEWFFQTLLIVC